MTSLTSSSPERERDRDRELEPCPPPHSTPSSARTGRKSLRSKVAVQQAVADAAGAGQLYSPKEGHEGEEEGTISVSMASLSLTISPDKPLLQAGLSRGRDRDRGRGREADQATELETDWSPGGRGRGDTMSGDSQRSTLPAILNIDLEWGTLYDDDLFEMSVGSAGRSRGGSRGRPRDGSTDDVGSADIGAGAGAGGGDRDRDRESLSPLRTRAMSLDAYESDQSEDSGHAPVTSRRTFSVSQGRALSRPLPPVFENNAPSSGALGVFKASGNPNPKDNLNVNAYTKTNAETLTNINVNVNVGANANANASSNANANASSNANAVGHAMGSPKYSADGELLSSPPSRERALSSSFRRRHSLSLISRQSSAETVGEGAGAVEGATEAGADSTDAGDSPRPSFAVSERPSESSMLERHSLFDISIDSDSDDSPTTGPGGGGGGGGGGGKEDAFRCPAAAGCQPMAPIAERGERGSWKSASEIAAATASAATTAATTSTTTTASATTTASTATGSAVLGGTSPAVSPVFEDEDEEGQEGVSRKTSGEDRFSMGAPGPSEAGAGAGAGSALTNAGVLLFHRQLLSDHEVTEILDFRHVYFFGHDATKANEPTLQNGAILENFGFDDDDGNLVAREGSHIAYRYEVVGRLGKGSFGVVHKCMDHKACKYVAIKVVKNRRRFHKQVANEVRILEAMRGHEAFGAANIIILTETFKFRRHVCLVFPLHGRSIFDYMQANKFKPNSRQFVLTVARQLLSCLSFLYDLDIIHCDLKPENILLTNETDFTIKLIDFGSSCLVNEKSFQYIQSRYYRAPEVMLGLGYGKCAIVSFTYISVHINFISCICLFFPFFCCSTTLTCTAPQTYTI
jgi:predicted Ser/Thr protein kinase